MCLLDRGVCTLLWRHARRKFNSLPKLLSIISVFQKGLVFYVRSRLPRQPWSLMYHGSNYSLKTDITKETCKSISGIWWCTKAFKISTVDIFYPSNSAVLVHISVHSRLQRNVFGEATSSMSVARLFDLVMLDSWINDNFTLVVYTLNLDPVTLLLLLEIPS